MSDVIEVTREQYAEIGRLLIEANAVSQASRNPALPLARKIEMQRQATALRNRAMEIGR